MNVMDQESDYEQAHDFQQMIPESSDHHSLPSFSLPYGMSEAALFSFIVSNNGLLSHLQEQFQPTDDDEHKEGLPKEFFDKIKKMKMGNSRRDCSVCYNSFKKGEKIRKLPCKHIFHDECIKPWLEKNITCPNCRLNLIEYFNEHPDSDY